MFSRLFVRARPSGVARPQIRASVQPPTRQPTLDDLKALYAEAVRGSGVVEPRDDA